MTRSRMLCGWLAVLVLGGSSPDARGQASTGAPAVRAATVDQRAEALLGLGRIARAQKDWVAAHARFTESDALRPFDATLREEHFWVAVECDRAAALRLAASLVADRRASADVHARRLALLRTPFDTTLLLSALQDAERAYPGDARWRAARADLALTLEERGDVVASREAWGGLSPRQREARPDWEASHLRVLAHLGNRAAVAPALDRYTARHPDDEGMRSLAIEAWADAGQPARALALLAPRLGGDARLVDLRRAADLATEAHQVGRARTFLSRVVAHHDHTAADIWRLAEFLASTRDIDALGDLLRRVRLDEGPCRERFVSVVTMAGADALLADLVAALPATCPGYSEVAQRIASVRLSGGDASAAERWLAPLRESGRLDVDGRILLARALTARQAWQEVDETLAPLVGQGPPPEGAALLAWAWHALGRSQDAWRLVQAALVPERDTVEQQAGWATIALAAGDDAAAMRLATTAVDSARDVDARVVLASLAARRGQPDQAHDWLAPVSGRLREPGQLLLWLDASAALDGPAAALQEADRLEAVGGADVDVLARRAWWSAALGRTDDARAFAARVQSRDASRAARLAVEMALAADDPSAAWGHVQAAPASQVAEAPAAWARLRIEAALASGHWDAAADAIAGARGVATADEILLAHARLELGRTGRLGEATRVDLARLVAADTHAVAARVALARDDLATGDATAALARLPVTDGDRSMPAEARAVTAAALLALGRPGDVLRLVSTDASEPVGLQLARGQALVAVGREGEARSLFEALALRSGRPEAYVAWTQTLETPQARIEVLERAVARNDASADLRAALAHAWLMAGRAADADAEARRTLERAPRSRTAWQVALSAQALLDGDALGARLLEARAALGDDPRDVLWLAEAAAGVSRLPDDVVALVLAWVRALPPAHAHAAAHLQARIAVATADWALAEAAIARLRQLSPDDLAVARLAAQVTAWRGAHAQAVPLYEAYLARQPGDVDAWREYARLLSWREDQQAAATAYARIRALTSSPAVEAEAASRLATLQRDWPAAARAAAAWRSLEPAALDPVVDLAQALEQQGDLRAAALVYAELESRADLPDPVRRTLETYRRRHAAQARADVRLDHADGFGGQRLMARRDTLVSASTNMGAANDVRIEAQIAEGVLDTGNAVPTSSLTEGRVGMRAALGAGWSLSGQAGAARVEGRTQAQGLLRLAAPVGARLAVEGTLERRPFWENAATLTAGLQATTGRVGVRLLGTGTLDVAAGLEAGRISDGARRVQVDAQVTRRFGRGPRVYALRLSGFAFGFDEVRAAYFSPAAFGRVDVEAGLTHWFGPGAVVRDGRFAVQGLGGAGVDSDGVPYGLASAGLVLPVGETLSLVATGRWTSARVYRAWGATIGLQLQPGGGSSARSSRTRQAPGVVQPR